MIGREVLVTFLCGWVCFSVTGRPDLATWNLTGYKQAQPQTYMQEVALSDRLLDQL